MQIWHNKVAIVTGGASGIGIGLVRTLALAGARVALLDRSQAQADEALTTLGFPEGKIRALGADVTDATAVEAAVTAVAEEWGDIDYLFNNAGIGLAGELRHTGANDWRRVLDVNLWGVIHGIHAVYPRMLGQGRGHIVNIASGAGLGPRPFMVAYATSKHAVVGLSTSLRAEAAPLGVRVSVACPGNIASNMLRSTTFRNLDADGLRAAIPFQPMSADECARRILQGVAKNLAIIPVQWIASAEWWLYRISPALYGQVSAFRTKKFRAHQTWIFLRGLMRDQRHWGAFPKTFVQDVADARVITLDFPGNGALNQQRSPLRVEAMAEWCRKELRDRGLQPPYRVLANSLGAMVTVAWADAYPQELSGIVLINTSLRPYSAFWQRMRPAAWPTLLRMALTAPDARSAETAILRLISHDPQRNAAALDDWTLWRKALPVSRSNALRQLIAAARFRAPASTPQVPTLLLVGAGDRLVDPACTHRLAQAWGCALAEHPAAGHDLPLDDGPWVAQQVGRWLASA